MGKVPRFFRTAPPIAATFNFEDIITGTGYINLFAGRGATDFLLSNIAFHSNFIASAQNTSSGTFIKRLDIDFDVLMNKQIIIEGKGFGTVSFEMTRTGAGGDALGYIIARLRKWDGSSETEIAVSAQGLTVTSSGGAVYGTAGLDMDVPQTIIKKGEYLRFTIEAWAKATGGLATIRIGHDPKGRIVGFDTDNNARTWDADYTTAASMLVPAKIDL